MKTILGSKMQSVSIDKESFSIRIFLKNDTVWEIPCKTLEEAEVEYQRILGEIHDA